MQKINKNTSQSDFLSLKY